MLHRLLLCLFLLVAAAAPARADDISAAGRSVVRVVVVSFDEQGNIQDFGHGSGFAVAPNRIVTNAHVVAMAQGGNNVAIGVVPSQGAQGTRARIITVDSARDLALLEVDSGNFTPLPIFTGPLDDGSPVAALGYPGNVDLATARSINDYIAPLPPTRSVGIFSNVRPINGITLLLHTAQIARGNSGGPLLDQCGRVVGVNTLITHNENGDSTFAFAVAAREITAFLAQAQQNFPSIATPCTSMADRLRQDQERSDADARAQDAAAARTAAQAQRTREHGLAEIEEVRENRAAIAILLLVLAVVCAGAGGILWHKDKLLPARILGGTGLLLLILAVVAFLTRPSLAAAEDSDGNVTAAATPTDRFVGHNLCRFQADRSRVTVSATNDVPLDWTASGCMNGRTQYASNGASWSRVLVPNDDQSVSVLQFTPGTGEYVVTRYLLDADAMTRLRSQRQSVDVKACTADADQRTRLADQQRDIAQSLPSLPNERLVYACEGQAQNQDAGNATAR